MSKGKIMTCTRCQGTGFINIHQLPDKNQPEGTDDILEWIDNNDDHDVSICDCCGDRDDWYGEPGVHYGSGDPPGPTGPYAYKGGNCECH